MEKRFTIALAFLLSLPLYNCSTKSYNPTLDVEPPVDREIRIRTGDVNYENGKQVDIKITNLLDDTAGYITCGDQDLPPSLVLRFESGKWIEQEVSGLCTEPETTCYCGTLKSAAEADKKILMPSPGLYKLRYSFEVKAQVVHFFSNEFEVIN